MPGTGVWSYFWLRLVCFAFLSFAMERFLANRAAFVGGLTVGLGGETGCLT